MAEYRYSAPAAACAAHVLRLLARVPAPQSLAAIARDVGCTKSLAFRVVRELEQAELVTKAGSQGYELGLGALELGAAVASRSGHAESMRDILKEVAESTGETVNVGVLRGADVLFIMKQEAPQFVVTISHIGRRLPANCSALGKILLARLSDEEIGKRLPAELPRLTSKSPADLGELLEDIRTARARGYAIDYESAILGRCALAIPIKLPQLGDDVAALAVTASVDDFEPRREALLEALIRARALAERGHIAREAIRDSLDEINVTSGDS